MAAGIRTGSDRPSRTAMACNGMVASPHALASAAGLSVLRDGGGAIDAAVAANAVLCVVYPDQTSIGGDCFLLYHEGATGQLHGLNGSGRAGLGADRTALRAAGHTTMPRRGIQAVTVPGTVDAWDAAVTRFGRVALADLLRPAIAYARDGFPVTVRLAAGIAAAAPMLAAEPAAAGAYLPGGAPPRAGDRLRLPALADSLALVAGEGRDAFYVGPIAERIAATARRLGGAITVADLATHRADWVTPLRSDYHGITVAELPPNSQGLAALIALNLAGRAELGTTWGAAAHLHPLVEATKLALATRDRHLADATAMTVDPTHLVSRAFAEEAWPTGAPERAAGTRPLGVADTVAICAVDGDGNAASLIQSIYQGFGSGVIADGTGIVLQNRGAGFSLADDAPNRLEPGRRPPHTLMPAMLLREGHLLGPLASQGGDAQAQVHVQLVTDLADFGLLGDPQAAIDAPRWVVGSGPEGSDTTLALEDRFPEETFADLAARGHDLVRLPAWADGTGHAQVILLDWERGTLLGGSDPRADGLALGF